MDEELHNSTEHRTVYNRSRSANVQDYLEEEAIQYIEDQSKKNSIYFVIIRNMLFHQVSC